MKRIITVFTLLAVVLVGWALHLVSAQDGSTPPITRLTVREPTLAQVEAHLLYYLPEAKLEYFNGFTWYSDTPIRYVELNGDGEDDLLVEGHLHVAALLWLGDRYSEPLQIYDFDGPRNPMSHVSLEDWTNDGVPEVVFDMRTAYSGTNIAGDTWKHYIIHCLSQSCNIAWEGVIADYFANYWATEGIQLYQTTLELIEDTTQGPILKVVATEFAANCAVPCGLRHDPVNVYEDRSLFRVGDSIETQYLWNGMVFELIDERIIDEGYVIELHSELETRSENGIDARIRTESIDSHYADQAPYNQCQLLVSSIPTGISFICIPDFTSVRWLDVTGDGQDELIVTTIAGESSARDGEKECLYQRFIAYQYQQTDLVEIANVTGCVVQSNLFGVRLENRDGDTLPEIVAAGQRMQFFTTPDNPDCIGMRCWYELNSQNEVYRWNGERFVYMETFSRS